jgi:hypothetical protein
MQLYLSWATQHCSMNSSSRSPDTSNTLQHAAARSWELAIFARVRRSRWTENPTRFSNLEQCGRLKLARSTTPYSICRQVATCGRELSLASENHHHADDQAARSALAYSAPLASKRVNGRIGRATGAAVGGDGGHTGCVSKLLSDLKGAGATPSK